MRIESPAIAFIHCERCSQIYDHQWLGTPPRNTPWEIHDGFCNKCKENVSIDYVPTCSEFELPPTLIMRIK